MALIGERLRQLRLNKNLTQKALAQQVGVGKKAISYYENNTREPPLGTLLTLAEVFNVSTDYILGRKNLGTPISAVDLTERDIAIVQELVQNMAEKNRSLKDV